MIGKIDPVDLAKNEKWLGMSKRIVIQQIEPCWYPVSCLNYDVIIVSLLPKYNFCVEISILGMLFLHNSQVSQPPIQFLKPQTFRAFTKDSLYIKTFLDRGVVV